MRLSWITFMYFLVFTIVCYGQSQFLMSTLDLGKIRVLKNWPTHEIEGSKCPIDYITITPMVLSIVGFENKDLDWIDLCTGVVDEIPKSSYLYRLEKSAYNNLPMFNLPIVIASCKNFILKKIAQ